MRTATHRIIAATAAGALSLLLAGCGGDDDKESTKSAESSPTSSSTPAEAPAKDAPATQTPTEGSPIDQVVTSSQEQLGSMKEAMKSTYADIEVVADGDSTLVYRYTYAKGAAAQGTAEALEAQSKTLAGTAKAIIPSLEAAGVKSPEVRYTYLDPQGDLIWEKTFTK